MPKLNTSAAQEAGPPRSRSGAAQAAVPQEKVWVLTPHCSNGLVRVGTKPEPFMLHYGTLETKEGDFPHFKLHVDEILHCKYSLDEI